jgi:hypothetical protein
MKGGGVYLVCDPDLRFKSGRLDAGLAADESVAMMVLRRNLQETNRS